MSLIQRQETCVTRMLEPRTSARRETKNRRDAVKAYRASVAGLGFSAADIDQQVRDIWDMYHLELNAEEP